MRIIRLLLLTGTILPTLALSGPSWADPAGTGKMQVAQGGPDSEGQRGGPSPSRERSEPRGERQDRPERPDRQERPAPRQERPEPRQERPERSAPREDRTPAERPAPRQERPDRQDRPDRQERPERQERPDPQERPARPERQERPDRQGRPDRQESPERQDRRPDQRGPTERPTSPAQRDRTPDPTRPSEQAPVRGAEPERRTPGAEPVRPDAPGRRGQDTGPAERQPSLNPAQPTAPTQPARPGQPATPPAAAPGAPQPVSPSPQVAPQGAPQTAPQVAPNARPGVPGRPFTPPGAPGAEGRDEPTGTGRSNERGQDTAPDRIAPRGPRDPDAARDQSNPRDRGDQPGLRDDGLRGGDRRSGVDDDRQDRERRDAFERGGPRQGFNAPGRPGYIPGGFRDDDETRDFDRVRRDRREFQEDGRTYIREPGRIIVRDRDRTFIRHDENERFRDLGRGGYRSERRGGDTVTYLDRPDGAQIVTIVDDDGRLVRRSRRFRDGREVVIIDNSFSGPRRPIYEDVVDLPPPDIRIPRERYVVDYEGADERSVYEALSAPPVVPLDRRYTLDQVRYSPQLRARMRSVDIDTITFETGSFTVTPDQASRLATIAAAMNQAIRANPQEVFLVEGYTDAVGSDVDNLSLSDRRAQSVATVLTQNFQVPPENLTTQGYGEQALKVNTQGPSRENRRVTVRRITPLIQQQAGGGTPPR